MLLQIVLLLSIKILPLQLNFLGGGLDNYLQKPYLWAWANFDGEHYISIARDGYQSLTYFYFPVYPKLIQIIAKEFNNTMYDYLFSGLLISHISLFLGLIGLVKLIRIDYSEKIAFTAITLLLLFPTSFYFGSVFTESLFFALIVWSFYFARKGNFLMAGILGGVSTATRITGLAVFPALLAEYFLNSSRSIKLKKSVLQTDISTNLIAIAKIMLVLLGMITYMYYLHLKTGDALAFFHNLNAVYGPQRSDSLVILPQVFYRYIFKVLPNLNFHYFPNVFTYFLEISTGTIFLIFTIILIMKRRISEGIYTLFAYLLPTLSGSFSSFPRYSLILFPAFILSAIYLNKIPRIYSYIVYTVLFVGLVISVSLFGRGYWIS